MTSIPQTGLNILLKRSTSLLLQHHLIQSMKQALTGMQRLLYLPPFPNHVLVLNLILLIHFLSTFLCFLTPLHPPPSSSSSLFLSSFSSPRHSRSTRDDQSTHNCTLLSSLASPFFSVASRPTMVSTRPGMKSRMPHRTMMSRRRPENWCLWLALCRLLDWVLWLRTTNGEQRFKK